MNFWYFTFSSNIFFLVIFFGFELNRSSNLNFSFFFIKRYLHFIREISFTFKFDVR